MILLIRAYLGITHHLDVAALHSSLDDLFPNLATAWPLLWPTQAELVNRGRSSYVMCVQSTRKPFEPFEHFSDSATNLGFE